MRHFSFLLSLLVINSFAIFAQEVVSPNKSIKIIVDAQKCKNKFGKVAFKVMCIKGSEYIEVLPNSPLGISRNDQRFTDSLKITGVSGSIAITDKYEMICGKRKLCKNSGNEVTFKFVNPNNQPVNIVFRAYNNGVAFKYEFPNSSDSVNIVDEATAYILPDSTNCWLQSFSSAYEGFFPLTKVGANTKKKLEYGYPALCKVNDQPLWMLISEANILRVHCATKLSNSANSREFKVAYPSKRKNFDQTGVKTTLPWNSQWHVIAIGALSDIVESTLITDLSQPNTLKETDWIKPGAVSWIYWFYNHGSKDYKKIVEYIDLAVEMKWPYSLVDWEWDVMSNGGNIEDAAKYAKSKGIKLLMWYNSGTSWLSPTPVDRLLTAQKRAEEFAWLNKIGIYGIKVDFFAGDQQDMMKYYIDILEDAAKYHLMVNFHGATVPRGWARTYPNLMTTEGVYGAEWYNNKPILTDKAACHNATLPFTRNVIGSMDYTPVTFSNSQHPHITSYSHELALSVVFESGFQHFADQPSAYYALPAEPKEFLKNIPAAWDDTKLIEGYPGESVVIARKKSNQWYIGGINGNDTAKTFKLNFDFLGQKEVNLQIIKDGANDKSFSTETKLLKNGELLNVACLPRGGFVITVKD